MIHQFQMQLTEGNSARLSSAYAYRLYAWLLEQLPPESAEFLHQQNAHYLSQSLVYDRETEQNLWTVNVFDDALSGEIRSVLAGTGSIALNGEENLGLVLAGEKTVEAQELVLRDREEMNRFSEIRFLTPTAFKQGGRYAIYPQEKLVLQSLMQNWNAVFPEIPIQDEDAVQAMLQGIHITDYSLHTTRYSFKGTRVPGFVGKISVQAKLALPLMELWNALLGLAPYSGIGIKTALGMGGVQVQQKPDSRDRAQAQNI